MSKKFCIKVRQDELDETKALNADSTGAVKITVTQVRWVTDGTWQTVRLDYNDIISFRDRARAEGFAQKLAQLLESA